MKSDEVAIRLQAKWDSNKAILDKALEDENYDVVGHCHELMFQLIEVNPDLDIEFYKCMAGDGIIEEVDGYPLNELI
ncbi:MAG: hypothetical protein R3240_00060 [Gammaproteobacteria bacterium]|nr:hypothetical protein [Gammaproteobacteria bacterium]